MSAEDAGAAGELSGSHNGVDIVVGADILPVLHVE